MVWNLVLMTARDVLAQHILWVAAAAVAVVVLVLPGPVKLALWRFVTATLPGQILMACLLSALAAWWLRGTIDDAALRRRDLAAQVEAAKRATAEAERAAAALATARLQAAAADRLAREQRDRADAIEQAAIVYQEEEKDYEAELAKRDAVRDPKPGAACALDAADLRGLRGAAERWGGRPAAAAAAAGLRPGSAGP